METTEFGWLDERIRLRCDSPALSGLVRRYWGAVRSPRSSIAALEYTALVGDGTRPTFAGPGGVKPLDRRQPVWHAYNALLQDLTSRVSGHFLIHGAVVARSARALILSAASTFGKTTLAVHLAARGFGLLADDIAALERTTGEVRPFPRALSLRPGTRSMLEPGLVARAARAMRGSEGDEWIVDPVEFLGPTPGPSRPVMVVIVRPQAAAEGPRRFSVFDLRFLDPDADHVDELAGLGGVSEVHRLDGCPWDVRVVADDADALRRWLIASSDGIVCATKSPKNAPDFSREPLLAPIGPFEAAIELCQEMMNRSEGSALAREFPQGEGQLLCELAGLLAGARCFALSAGRLDRTLELIEGAFASSLA